MNRRDFLGSDTLTRAAGQVLGAVRALHESPTQDSQECSSFLRFHHRAMATDWEFIVPFGTPEAMTAADLIFGRVDQLEDRLSVYRSHSEISQLNQTAWQRPCAVEPELFDLFILATRLTDETERALDPAAAH